VDQSTPYKYFSPERILPKEILDHLSLDSTKLFVKVWNLMNKKSCTEVWLSDKAASVMSRVDIDELWLAKQQLVEVGLFEIKHGRWPMDDPENICHRYRFVAEQNV
jgi:hypothetical protein